MTTTTETTTTVTGWAVGTVPDDPFALIPTGDDFDMPTQAEKPEQAPAVDVTAGYTAKQIEAAQDAIDDGAVIRVGHLFLVVSSDGSVRYETAVTGECSCRAAIYGRRCWHVLAARLAYSAGWPDTDPDEIGWPPLDSDTDGDADSVDPIESIYD